MSMTVLSMHAYVHFHECSHASFWMDIKRFPLYITGPDWRTRQARYTWATWSQRWPRSTWPPRFHGWTRYPRTTWTCWHHGSPRSFCKFTWYIFCYIIFIVSLSLRPYWVSIIVYIYTLELVHMQLCVCVSMHSYICTSKCLWTLGYMIICIVAASAAESVIIISYAA